MVKAITIGLVVPFPTDDVPMEGAEMYPGMRFIAKGVGVRSLTPAGYEQANRGVLPAAKELARQGVDAIMVIGTSLTFYRGAAFNAEIIDQIRAATGLPVGTMSSAIVEGLRAVGARRLAVATAYADEVNDLLRTFLQQSGFEVLSLEGFGHTDFFGPHAVSEASIVDLSGKVRAAAPDADALLISCGGLRTLNVTAPIEASAGIPVVSSMPASFWSAMRLVGQDARLAGHGRLLAEIA